MEKNYLSFTENPLFFVSTTIGLEEALSIELKRLGFKNVVSQTGGVEVHCELQAGLELNYKLRTAQRIYLLVKSINASTKTSLYDKTRTIGWDKLIEEGQEISLSTKGIPKGMASHYASQIIKDGIVDTCRKYKNGWRPEISKEGEIGILNVFQANKAHIYLDTSGRSLSDRGFRKKTLNTAPLRESIARAALELCGFSGSETLVDGMTGTGTIVLEAASWDQENEGPFQYHFWKFVSLPKLERKNFKFDFKNKFGVDLKKSSFPDRFPFVQKNFLEFNKPSEQGIVIVNPPYGDRLTDKNEDSYQKLGFHLKDHYGGFTAGVFAGNKKDLKQIRMKPEKTLEFIHGGKTAYFSVYKIRNSALDA